MNASDSSLRRSWCEPATAATRIVRGALEDTAERMQVESVEALLDQLRDGDRADWSEYERFIAQHVGEYLETCDENVKAAYIYDHEWSPDHSSAENKGRAPLIHLIVWAQPKTAALRALIDILNRTLALRLGMIMGKPPVTQLLDVQVIDDQEVSQRSGYAALLTSPRHRPAQVWKRRAALA